MHVAGNRFRRTLALGVAAAALVAGGQAASAQTTTTPPYPGNPTTTQPGPNNSTVNLGARGLGSRFTVSQCGYREGGNVPFDVNNESAPADVADSNTCVQETFFIRPNLEVALGATRIGGMLGVTGLAQTARIVVVEVNGKPIRIGPLGSTVTSIARGTGVNGQPRTVTVSFTVLRAHLVDGNGNLLARSGSTLLKFSPIGAGLVAGGYMLVLVARRRRATLS